MRSLTPYYYRLVGIAETIDTAVWTFALSRFGQAVFDECRRKGLSRILDHGLTSIGSKLITEWGVASQFGFHAVLSSLILACRDAPCSNRGDD
jgi:hypothetical protein